LFYLCVDVRFEDHFFVQVLNVDDEQEVVWLGESYAFLVVGKGTKLRDWQLFLRLKRGDFSYELELFDAP